MGRSPSSPVPEHGSTVRAARTDPHLRIQSITIFVRDQDRSLRFYVDQLGFRLLHDSRGPAGERWIAVGPPDGTALLALVTARPGSGEQELIGRPTQIVFVTEDVPAKFSEWSERGVRFRHPPQTPAWAGSSRGLKT